MAAKTASYLLVLGDRRALAWVLRKERMAFAPRWRSLAAQLRPGDGLLLYATRGCFGNPTRDRGELIGEASVLTAAEELSKPVTLGQRTLSLACGISVDSLTPLRSGVELAPLVSRLRAFRRDRAWAGQLRRPLLPLPEEDVRLLRKLLTPRTRSPAEVLGEYLDAAEGRFPQPAAGVLS